MSITSYTVSSAEFLRLRKNLTHNDELLDKLDEQITEMCTQQPDEAARVLDALAHSDTADDRRRAAHYLRDLLTDEHHKATTALLQKLLHDPDQDVHHAAEDTITAAVESNEINIIDAARLYDDQTPP